MKRYKKVLSYVVVILIIFFSGLIVYDFKDGMQQSIEYSCYNLKSDGTRYLYLLTEKMGYDTDVFIKPARFLPNNTTAVAIQPTMEIIDDGLEKKYLKQWLERGNNLILIGYKLEEYIETLGGTQPVKFGQYDLGYKYAVGDGSVIFFSDSEKYTNSGVENLEHGVQFIDALEEIGLKKVLFVEYFHGMGSDAGLWDILSYGIKLTVVQLAICLIIFLFIVTPRFGKSVTVFEIFKRQENENLFALSNIYYKAKANGIALDIYLSNLKQRFAKFLGLGRGEQSDADIVRAANANNALKKLDVGAVFAECDSFINKKGNSNELLILYKRLEAIRKEIK